jgi:(4-O-methyl)-D-glucuronate---lignin esterase
MRTVLLAWGIMAAAAVLAADLPPPLDLSAEQDHKRMMDQLGITSIRQGANGRDPNAPNAANYDEAKGNPYPDLPDALTLDNGKPVRNAKQWWSRRRPQIVEHFDREVYGRLPKHIPRVSWKVTETRNEKSGDEAVVTRKLVGHVDNSAYPLINVDIEMFLTTPADARGVPVIIEFFPPEWAARIPPQPSPSWQEQVIARGWAYAILSPTSIQADNGAGLTRGIIGLVNKGQTRKPDDWGALRAWAWGASRALDYLETDPAVDAKRAVIEGVSRYGKASLVTMAYEPRFAIGFIGSSGMGGAALHRRRIGELLENVASSGEYHWMAGNYIKYAGPLTAKDLPVDAHELIALSAPRPLFIGAGNPAQGDAWVDPRGMFMATAAASPVYRLLGKRAIDVTEFPPMETALTAGELAFRQHAGGHTSYPNWPIFLDYARRYFEPPLR